MSDWRSRLREADVEHGGGLSAADVQRVRRAVIGAAVQPREPAGWAWSGPFLVVTTVLVMFCVSVLAALQEGRSAGPGAVKSRHVEGSGPDGAGPPAERQQLQFATPGGTRIIWVFDSQFDVKGTLP